MSAYLFLISSCISGPDGPAGFEPEIKWREHEHRLFLQQAKVYITTNLDSHLKSESGS